jgi:hypothetical protein
MGLTAEQKERLIGTFKEAIDAYTETIEDDKKRTDINNEELEELISISKEGIENMKNAIQKVKEK